jgi:hypothetical protein
MLKTAPVRRLHAASAPVPPVPARHPLHLLADRVDARIAGCACTVIAGCHEPAMLMVERPATGAPGGIRTWLVTVVSPATFRLEAMVGESRLDLLLEGPPDRILAHLGRLGRRTAPREVAAAGI